MAFSRTTFKVKIEGFDETISTIKAFPKEALDTIESKVLDPSLDIMKNEIQARAPRGETGELAASIEVKRGKKGEWVWGDISALYYGWWVEFGHALVSEGRTVSKTRVAPQPFMRPVLDKEFQPILSRTAASLKGVVEKANKKLGGTGYRLSREW